MRLLAPAFKFHFKEGRRTMILSVLSSFALVSGLMVVRAKNPVHSVLFFILVFCDTSGLLILLGLDFFAMIFLVVYIGAIAVLFLFVVMMFNIQIAEIHEEVLRYLPVSGIIGLIFWWEMFFILDNETIPLLPTHRNTTSLGYTVYAGKVRSWTNLETLGNLLYTYYFVWFLVSSLILLVAMIGAIVLTMHRTTKVKRQDVFRRNALDFRRTIISRRRMTIPNRRCFSSEAGGSFDNYKEIPVFELKFVEKYCFTCEEYCYCRDTLKYCFKCKEPYWWDPEAESCSGVRRMSDEEAKRIVEALLGTLPQKDDSDSSK
jgi:NADH-ubiquinone oxidoreductase chain 6